MIRVLFLAQLREQVGTAEIQIPTADLDAVKTIAALKDYLVNKNPAWEPHLANSKLLVAINHEYARTEVAIKDGDEIAFFPPVTGG
jgi:molybdopterin synthase sulfur carrier subunit